MNGVDDLAQFAFGIFRAHRLENDTRLVHTFLSDQPAWARRNAEKQNEKEKRRNCRDTKLPAPFSGAQTQPADAVVGEIGEQNADDNIYLEGADQAAARFCGG